MNKLQDMEQKIQCFKCMLECPHKNALKIKCPSDEMSLRNGPQSYGPPQKCPFSKKIATLCENVNNDV